MASPTLPSEGIVQGVHIQLQIYSIPHFISISREFLIRSAQSCSLSTSATILPQSELEPLQQFISDFGSRLREISLHYLADPRPIGGSLFRIYRDTRFSKDKSPYKTFAGIQFRHESGRDVHSPGFYLHLGPDNVFAGVGIWHPDQKTLRKIRDAIVEAPNQWRKAISNKAFTAIYKLDGDSLKRPPQGYNADHPLIEDLKRKDFIASVSFTEEAVCAPDFIDRYEETCRSAALFMSFLTTATRLPW